MKRRLLNLVTVLSLVLCVAARALWVRSYRHLTAVYVWDEGTLYGARMSTSAD
jgi:hypothetical protein